MKWITRQNIKVDRVACPWLIRRFIDEKAQRLFAPENEVLAIAAREDAVPFDMPRNPELKFTHHKGLCTFEVLLREFDLKEPALARRSEERRVGKECGCRRGRESCRTEQES